MVRRMPGRAALLALALAAACGGAGAGPAGGGAAPTGPVWTLGAMNDLTGAGSNGGRAQQQGLSFFVDQTNRAGGVAGHRLRVQSCDTQSTPTGGAACARQLSTVDSHVVLLGGALPSTLGAVPQLTDVLGVSVLPVLFPKAGTTVFQVSAVESAVVAPMLAAARASHLTTIGVLYTTDASGTAQLAAVQQGAGAAGLRVVTQPMSPGASDVTTQLLQLRSGGAQVIFLASIGGASTTGLTSYHTLAMDLPVVLGAQAVTNTFLQALPFPVPKKLYGISTMALGTQGVTAAEQAAWKSFRSQFRSYAHEPVDTEHASAYYSGCVAAAALLATSGGTAKDMAAHLAGGPVTCLGAALRFDTPGLNVVTGQPTALSQAGPNASDGWGPVRNPM